MNYTLTAFELKFARLIDKELVLSPLAFPPTTSAAPCSGWFSIENHSNEPVQFDVEVNIIEELKNNLEIQVFSMSSNTPLKTVLLETSDAKEIRLRGN